MIEVERKFRVTPEQRERLVERAVFRGQVTHTDQFFDTKNLQLAVSDRWLRKRNGMWELKISRDPHFKTRKADIYDELTNDEDIQRHLGFNLEGAIQKGLLIPWTHLQTVRSHYEADGYSLDFDDVTSLEDDFTYQLMEIEIMVEAPAHVDEAAQRILQIAQNFGLSLDRPQGKVLAYLQQKKPDLFIRLNEAWRQAGRV